MKAALLFTILTLSATAIVAEAPSTLMVFAPEGALVILVSSEGVQNLSSGVAHSRAVGPVEVLVNLAGFEPYSRSLNLASGRQAVLVPRLVPSSESRLALRERLLRQKERVLAQREGVSLATLGVGVAALAGWSAVGALEWGLATKKTQLVDAQASYRAASADQTASAWSAVESLKAEISTLRTYQAYAAGASGLFSLGALSLWLLGPDTGRWDDALRRLEEKE